MQLAKKSQRIPIEAVIKFYFWNKEWSAQCILHLFSVDRSGTDMEFLKRTTWEYEIPLRKCLCNFRRMLLLFFSCNSQRCCDRYFNKKWTGFYGTNTWCAYATNLWIEF